MKVMVTGSRDLGACQCAGRPGSAHECPDKYAAAEMMENTFIEHGLTLPTARGATLFHGGAHGADSIAAALWEHWGIGPVLAFPARWDMGKHAGRVRNDIMINHMPDLVLAYPTELHGGTRHAIKRAKEAGLDVHIYEQAP